MKIKKQKKPVRIKWENIISPKEMEEKFGSSKYLISKSKDGEIYINSNYFVKKLLKNPKNRLNPKNIIEDIPWVYWSILSEMREVENKKRYGNIYDEILRYRLKK